MDLFNRKRVRELETENTKLRAELENIHTKLIERASQAQPGTNPSKKGSPEALKSFRLRRGWKQIRAEKERELNKREIRLAKIAHQYDEPETGPEKE